MSEPKTETREESIAAPVAAAAAAAAGIDHAGASGGESPTVATPTATTAATDSAAETPAKDDADAARAAAGDATPRSAGGGAAGSGSRRDALLGRLAQWRRSSPAVESLLTTTASQLRAAATSGGGAVFASPLRSARLSPAHRHDGGDGGFFWTARDRQRRDDDSHGEATAATAATGPTEEQAPEPQAAPASERRPSSASSSSASGGEPDDSGTEDGGEDETVSDSSSFVSRSTRTSNGSSNNAHNFPFVWAAASVVDSMQTQFRGRYAGAAPPGPQPPTAATPPPAGTRGRASATPTQLARMLSGTQQAHIQRLVHDLAPHEYMMLLGRGMLGVNLKQCYLRQAGVYVDFLVPGGAADQTRHVRVGDLLRRVGSASVERGTIVEIPRQIAAAPRPLHLVWATGTPTPAERMTAVDVCVALMHQHRRQRSLLEEEEEEDEEDIDETKNEDEAKEAGDHGLHNQAADGASEEDEGKSKTPMETSDLRSGSDSVEDEKKTAENGDREETSLQQSRSAGSDTSTTAEAGRSDLVLPDQDEVQARTGRKDQEQDPQPAIEITYAHSVDRFCRPRPLPLHVRQALQGYATKRNNEGFDPLELSQAAGADCNFYAAVQHAFLECVSDGRRFPFLARHLSMLEDRNSDPDRECTSAVKSPNAMLMLFSELVNFMDLYGVTPVNRRWELANQIAYKFFLPTQLGKELVPPMFDFHHIASDSSLRKLENALTYQDKVVPKDIFFEFATAAMESLTGYPFLSFLASPECARMRAYLRNVALFVNVPLDQVLQGLPNDHSARNYMSFIILYLLCQTDKEGFGEHDDLLSKGEGIRVEHAVSNVCASLYIMGKVLPTLEQPEVDDHRVLEVIEQLWEYFVDPICGALEIVPRSGGPNEVLKTVRLSLEKIRSDCAPLSSNESDYIHQVSSRILAPSFQEQLCRLAHELAYEYAANVHAKLREHKYHEWICTEIATADSENDDGQFCVPRLNSGCVKRLLRKASFPNGVAPHKPTHIVKEVMQYEVAQATHTEQVAAEYAIIFGSVLINKSTESAETEISSGIQRYSCQSLVFDEESRDSLTMKEIPATLEDYAIAPPFQSKPFSGMQGGPWKSLDGWIATIQSFVVPRADATSESGDDSPLFGCSLVFQKISGRHDPKFDSNIEEYQDFEPLSQFQRYIQKLKDQPWINHMLNDESARAAPIIGIALVSQSNKILSMRGALSQFLRSLTPENRSERLVNILGNFMHEDVEAEALSSLLRPFLISTASPWIDRPITAQTEEFERQGGLHLIRSLPPTPLALMFITALLEQKLVFTSSRRSLLLSATTALQKILRPLRWWHLWVPCVPSSLAGDLLQYPAPFILGVSSEDPEIMDYIRDLPRDVTLVDLDVGRVILAPAFAHNCELGRGVPNNVNTSRALRQQVLFMSQALGGVFGSAMDPETWGCDGPEITDTTSYDKSAFDKLCGVCHNFIQELLAGTTSCCYWIEESGSDNFSDPTVLFDEDRFFHVKNMRANEGFVPLFATTQSKSNELAITLEDFDLVLEVFLRCQSMNVYIGSRDKDKMAMSM